MKKPSELTQDSPTGESTAMPVKLSARLVSLAKPAAQLAGRSLTAQVEHWSILGMEIEKLLSFEQAQALKHADQNPQSAQIALLRQALRTLFSSPDRSAAIKLIQGDALPVYEGDPDKKGGIRQVWPDGRTVAGSMRGREFVPDVE
jgi:hypothetical protein